MKSSRSLLPFLAVLAAGAGGGAKAPAAAIEHPLGRNLVYVRVHVLPGDLPASSARHQGVFVLDLRFVAADADASRAFVAWLKFQARPASPVIVLINAQTSPILLAPLADSQSLPGVISVGPAAEAISPDIALHLGAEADRLAYDAFEHGTPLEELIDPKLDKARHDESTISKERSASVASNADPESTDDFVPLPNTAERIPPPPPPAPFDAVLQRARQLHRALLALKKIP